MAGRIYDRIANPAVGTQQYTIEAWVDLGTGPRPLRDGESLGEGDRVQLRYDSHGAAFVAHTDDEVLVDSGPFSGRPSP